MSVSVESRCSSYHQILSNRCIITKTSNLKEISCILLLQRSLLLTSHQSDTFILGMILFVLYLFSCVFYLCLNQMGFPLQKQRFIYLFQSTFYALKYIQPIFALNLLMEKYMIQHYSRSNTVSMLGSKKKNTWLYTLSYKQVQNYIVTISCKYINNM